ncbi:hypothetical protein Tco_0804582 [Tanacetum coccineum]|uniref:Uncharacterized protein n=1 Tax=Tanacetum coccineum TaxID=301880 RepID=A0ABQ5A4Q8_9ASTR
MYTIEERSKLLAKNFKRRKKLLAEERVVAVRNKPPTRTQLRSLMMTYLKHTCKYRHNQLNKKTFEEIQALYIKEQERDADFVPIGSERDEKMMIDKMNKKAAGMDEEEVPEEPESTKVEVKQEGREENIRKRSGRRLKMKATKKSKRKKTNSDLEVINLFLNKSKQIKNSFTFRCSSQSQLHHPLKSFPYKWIPSFCKHVNFSTIF